MQKQDRSRTDGADGSCARCSLCWVFVHRSAFAASSSLDMRYGAWCGLVAPGMPHAVRSRGPPAAGRRAVRLWVVEHLSNQDPAVMV